MIGPTDPGYTVEAPRDIDHYVVIALAKGFWSLSTERPEQGSLVLVGGFYQVSSVPYIDSKRLLHDEEAPFVTVEA